jgi:hypothetical protein
VRGRKPTSTALHAIHGNPSRLAPSARAAEPKPVGALSATPQAPPGGSRRGRQHLSVSEPPADQDPTRRAARP